MLVERAGGRDMQKIRASTARVRATQQENYSDAALALTLLLAVALCMFPTSYLFLCQVHTGGCCFPLCLQAAKQTHQTKRKRLELRWLCALSLVWALVR